MTDFPAIRRFLDAAENHQLLITEAGLMKEAWAEYEQATGDCPSCGLGRPWACVECGRRLHD